MKKKLLPALLVIALAVLSVAALSGCTARSEKYVFGTYYSIELKGNGAQKKAKEIDALFAELDNFLSTSKESSDISRINSAKAGVPVSVSAYTADILNAAFNMSAETFSAFNPAIFPLVELWKFSPDTFIGIAESVPTATEIASILLLCSVDNFVLDKQARTVVKNSDDAKLDLGAVGKGYATDLAFGIASGLKNIVIDVGRTIRISGESDVYIASPRESGFAARFTLKAQSVSTSGDYERFYTVDGVRYHHILDRSGYPAGIGEENPIQSVTVVGESAAVCDMLSTAVIVLGVQDSAPILARMGYSALILTANGFTVLGDNIFEILDGRH